VSAAAKKIVIISASPKAAESSASDDLSAMGKEVMEPAGAEVYRINVRKSLLNKQTEQDYARMLDADALIFIFPLYFFCLPGMLMRFLQDYADYRGQRKENTSAARVYAVINCGFPEPEINEEAAGVIERFSVQTGCRFRFALLIGGGGMLQGAKDAPFMKKIMARIKDAFGLMLQDLSEGGNEPRSNILVSMKFPRRLYFFMGNLGWSSEGKKNGLKKKDLYRTPYCRTDGVV
jgi:acetylornithine deacetylase/succinyl-diaminopimelate desuccinylase-like protein